MFLGIWYAGAVVKIAAAFRMWSNGLIEQFPTLWAFLIVAGCRSALMAASHRSPHYVEISSYSLSIELLLEAFAIVGVFFTLTKHYPNHRRPGTALLMALALLGTAASIMTRYLAISAGWHGIWESAVLVERYFGILMVFILVGERALLPSVRGIPISQTGRRAADLLTSQVTLTFACSLLATLANHRYTLFSYFAPVSVSLAASLLWLFCLNPADDEETAALTPKRTEFPARSSRFPAISKSPDSAPAE